MGRTCSTREMYEEIRAEFLSENVKKRATWKTQTQHAAHIREMTNGMQNFSRKREGKRPLGRSRSTSKWKDAMNVDHKETGLEAVDCVHLSGRNPVTGSFSPCS
jgi:hypothetical protein